MNLTKYGMNNVPTKSNTRPTPNVTKKLSKGVRKRVKTKNGKTVSKENIKRPEIVILCTSPQLSHLNGWYIQCKNAL